MYAVQAIINNNWSWRDFTRSIILGAATGAVSAGLGQVFSTSGFWGTVGNGTLTGAGTGAVTALITGQNFLEGISKGAVIGGSVAAISYSINYLVKYAGIEDEFKYYENENPVQNGETLEYSNQTLQKMRSDNFTLEEMQRYRVEKDLIGSKKYSLTSDGFFQTGKGKAYAYTTPPNFFSGTSYIHYSKAAFASKEILFTTMLHETGHAYIMNAGNFFIKQYDKMKLFSPYKSDNLTSNINNLGHASIYSMEHLSGTINNFSISSYGGVPQSVIDKAINNAITGNQTQGYNLIRSFIKEIFSRKYIP